MRIVFAPLRVLLAPLALAIRLAWWPARVAYRNQTLLLSLTAFITMAVMAAVSGYWIFYRLAYVLGAVIPLCFVWARLHVRGLEVTVERSHDRLQVGQETEARVHLKSGSGFTKLWLEVEDRTDMPEAAARTVVTLPARGRRNWKVTMRCKRRGVYTVGPVRVTSGDPFGLFQFTRSFGEESPLLVLPQPEELPYFSVPAAQLPGEGSVRQRTHYVTPNAAGIREYHPGDSYNRIHWPSTARLGRLAVKTFEMDPASNIWIVLDLNETVQAGAEDDATEECGVRIAASLAWRFLQENSMVGLAARGAESVVLDPARGTAQYGRILETLATARAEGSEPIARVLQEESRRFGRHTTVIVITPAVDEDWVLALGALAHQGARTTAVIMEPASFGSVGEPHVPYEALAAAGVPAYIVPRGSDIGLILGPAGLAGAARSERMAGVR